MHTDQNKASINLAKLWLSEAELLAPGSGGVPLWPRHNTRQVSPFGLRREDHGLSPIYWGSFLPLCNKWLCLEDFMASLVIFIRSVIWTSKCSHNPNKGIHPNLKTLHLERQSHQNQRKSSVWTVQLYLIFMYLFNIYVCQWACLGKSQ